ncbi:sensor histidine kinase [Peribacillus tepidiphilus]|jgi:two-component system sensor histidine kinase CiaH|uniref:sensor histidine kinase n=1 Tax=Peribacillus tepidiphilus TaxID=2652445 RepID=UPI0035B5273B
MFQKTRIKLTLLNSIIFIFIIGALASVIFSYIKVQLYQDSDEDLQRLMIRFNEMAESGFIPLDPELGIPSYIRDPRITMLIWDENNNVVDISGSGTLFSAHKESFVPKKNNRIEEKSAEGYYFRTISDTFQTEIGTIKIQLLRNVNSEQEFLSRLQIVMTVGSVMGSLVAIVAGFYLAGRAFVPIKEAWGKQQQFVSDASHELRTPLAVIQSRSELLLRNPQATIQEKASDISVIAKECRRLTKLVSHLLLLARSDSNSIVIEKKLFSLNELLGEIEENYAELALIQGKNLHVHCDPGMMMIGDKEKIHQLIVILLDNAMKYTDDHGEIILICKKTGSQIEMIVQDNGIGISKEHLPKIFDRFFQGEQSRTSSEGAGLGLSIAKWIIEKHNGKVKVDSTLGKGTTFKILFPI